MKKVSVILALVTIFFAGLALANTATVTSLTGNVQAQTGSEPVRTLRVGDLVRQGDTVSTGAASSAVLRFEDGQVTALTARSRLTITAYQYNPQTQSGSILLSLVDGGMRAITGLIGRRSPENVAYRAATATIGIRGTDITVVTSQGNVVVTVADGVISFRVGDGPPTIVVAGNAASLTQGQIRSGPAATIINALPLNLGVALTNATSDINQLAAAIGIALGPAGDVPGRGTPSRVDVSTVPSGGTGGGGGGASGPTACPPGQVLNPTTGTCS
ncbi:MAG TPA: FecR domain-containing protein [Usitatibacter sp.]|nr:FecR domain-containing protein [Usitatibacter sp.]